MQLTWYDKKRNTLYINTDAIMCDTTGMSFRERAKAMDEHFKLSYEERIEQSKYRDDIKQEIAMHPDCKLSEFSSM